MGFLISKKIFLLPIFMLISSFISAGSRNTASSSAINDDSETELDFSSYQDLAFSPGKPYLGQSMMWIPVGDFLDWRFQFP